MRITRENLVERFNLGDMRALAKLISLIENRDQHIPLFEKFTSKAKVNTHVLGITGSPGAGKSTLVDQLAQSLFKLDQSVAILAIDPTSPFSGGAVLGDRIRMQRTSEEEKIFIRSMATRGALGGISAATYETLQAMSAFGFQDVLVETVGVGQGEIDIVRTADTCAVVLVPGMGDAVQSMKAGILEIADIFVINKADRDGADTLVKDLNVLLSLGEYHKDDWKPLIVKTVATTGEGLPEFLKIIGERKAWLESTVAGREKKLSVIRENLIRFASELILERNQLDPKKLAELSNRCLGGELNFFSAARQLVSA